MEDIIHMDVGAVLHIAKELREMAGQLGNYIHSLGNHVYGLPPDWQGGAAQQFFGEYEIWAGALSGYASDLLEIADKIEEAAAAWQEVDSRFG